LGKARSLFVDQFSPGPLSGDWGEIFAKKLELKGRGRGEKGRKTRQNHERGENVRTG